MIWWGLDWTVSPRGLYRAPALLPLSRDHHEALIQALWLKRRAGRPPAALGFLEFHRAELEGHMADEEEVVLPVAEAVDPAGAARIRQEHGEIRRLAATLETATAAGQEIAATMEDLARLLHDHVRYEERVFFMGVQAALPSAALESMGTALEAHRAARGVAAFCRIRPR
jgi:iron-sulfur cluster repair protein YtfE (RIC family)